MAGEWWQATAAERRAEYDLRVDGEVAGVSSIFGHTATIQGAARSENRVLTHMYPVKWFRAQQNYVAALVAAKPVNDSVREQVYWALALMAAVTDGLFFANVNDIVWSRAIYGDPTLLGGESLEWGQFRFPCVGVPGDTWGPVMEPLWTALPEVVQRVPAAQRKYVCPTDPTATPTPFFGTSVPFFGGPLIGHPYQRTYLVGVEDSDRPNYFAPWWSEYIAKPQARHVPWIHKAHPLWYAPLLRIRANSKGAGRERTQWEWETIRDVKGTTELEALEMKGGRLGVLVRRYRMMAFGVRYETSSSTESVPTLSDVVRTANRPGSLFQSAFAAGAYDVVGRWFAGLDPSQLIMAANTDWIDFLTAGLTGRKFLGEPYGIAFLARDDWKDVKKAQKVANIVDKLSPITTAVDFVVGMFSGNYLSSFIDLQRSVISIAKQRSSLELKVWDLFRQTPNIFLHSLGGVDEQKDGYHAYFNTCCGNTGKVYERMAFGFRDCQSIVDSAVRRERLTERPLAARITTPALATQTSPRDGGGSEGPALPPPPVVQAKGAPKTALVAAAVATVGAALWFGGRR